VSEIKGCVFFILPFFLFFLPICRSGEKKREKQKKRGKTVYEDPPSLTTEMIVSLSSQGGGGGGGGGGGDKKTRSCNNQQLIVAGKSKTNKRKRLLLELEQRTRTTSSAEETQIVERHRERVGVAHREIEENEAKRIENDIIYSILFSPNQEQCDCFVGGLVYNITKTFENEMSSDSLRFIRSIPSQNYTMKHFFLFAGLVYSDRFLDYFSYGNPEKDEPAPKMYDRCNFSFYVNTCVKPAIEKVLVGEKTMEEVVYWLRSKYVAVVGYYRDLDPTRDSIISQGFDERGRGVIIVERDRISQMPQVLSAIEEKPQDADEKKRRHLSKEDLMFCTKQFHEIWNLERKRSEIGKGIGVDNTEKIENNDDDNNNNNNNNNNDKKRRTVGGQTNQRGKR
jgi:hypothetical protein